MKKRAKKEVPVDRHRLTFKTLRLIKGISPAEVARKTGVCYQTVVNMRKAVSDGGTIAPRVSVLDRIGRAYGMRLDFVEMNAPQTVGRYSHTEKRNGAENHASFN